MRGSRKPKASSRGLVMPPGRSIPRAPAPKRKRTDPLPEPSELPMDVVKAAGELVALQAKIRACPVCTGDAEAVAYGTGFPRARVFCLKDVPSAEDLESGNAFTAEAEALGKAFDVLGVPFARLYGATAVRAQGAEICAQHLSEEIEAVSPAVLVAFGAADAVRALDGRCGICIPDDLDEAAPVAVRSDLHVLVTEALPAGVTRADAKRRLWRDLRLLTELL